MSGIYVFTAGNADARSHLNDSIIDPIPLRTILDYIPSEQHQLIRNVEKEASGLYAWGAVDGIKNKPCWESLSAGDYILTGYSNQYHFVSRVIWKTRNEAAARAVWGSTKDGNTWEFMYFLTKPQKVEIPYSELTPELNSTYRGFWGFNEARIDAIREAYGSVDTFIGERFGTDTSRPNTPQAELELLGATAEADEGFNPATIEDSREKTVQAIFHRQGQPAFRRRLLAAYKKRCAITGCDVPQALEAAHIVGYKGLETNAVCNGILMRADIHTLFDLRLLSINGDYKVELDESLGGSLYSAYEGKEISLPNDKGQWPSIEALKLR